METLNLEIQLSNEKFELLNKISKHTGFSSEKLLNDIINDNASWAEFQELNEINEEANNRNIRRYTMEEIEESLITGVLPE